MLACLQGADGDAATGTEVVADGHDFYLRVSQQLLQGVVGKHNALLFGVGTGLGIGLKGTDDADVLPDGEGIVEHEDMVMAEAGKSKIGTTHGFIPPGYVDTCIIIVL